MYKCFNIKSQLDATIIIKLLLLHLVGFLYYCINDARSHKHQMYKYLFSVIMNREN